MPILKFCACTEDVVLSPHLTVRTYFPPTASTDAQQLLPVGVYFHGGGWCCGDLDCEDNFCRMLAKTLPAVVISVSYRLAPEHKAPAQVQDAVDAWTWVCIQLYSGNIRTEKKIGHRKRCSTGRGSKEVLHHWSERGWYPGICSTQRTHRRWSRTRSEGDCVSFSLYCPSIQCSFTL